MNMLPKIIVGLMLFCAAEGVGKKQKEEFDESKYLHLPPVAKLSNDEVVDKVRRDGMARVENIFDDKLVKDMYKFCDSGVPIDRLTHHNVQVPLIRHVLPFMNTFMKKFHSVITDTVGPDSQLFELAILVNQQGATRQRTHADFDYEIKDSSKMISFLIALQDVTIDMGPTEIWNGTHTHEAHKKYCPKTCEESLLRDDNLYPMYANLNAGETLVLDSKIIHRGGPSTNPTKRIYVWISFIASPGKPPGGSPPTIFPDYLERLKLSNYHEWTTTLQVPESILEMEEYAEVSGDTWSFTPDGYPELEDLYERHRLENPDIEGIDEM
eukprot:TRINITY_DN14633_c0_g1_i1.p1 TRINITY_DN14633_c0_g1~~TRINITY_DN14633_c0_g1_i1.p1  ORF type:complete len:325 (+),score=60.78 TRINITY_DN14633_c0_g1_i1:52-1026(+)